MAENNEKVTKKTFTVKVGEKDVEFVVKRPTQKQQQDAMRVYNRAFAEAIKPSDGQRGALCRAAIQTELRKQGLWDDEKERKYREVVKRIADGEKKLKAGKMKLSEGRRIAVDMMKARSEFQELIQDRNALDTNTAEAQAEQVKFEFQVANCTYDKSGVPYFKGVEDYNQRADDPVAVEAARHLANLVWDLDDAWREKLPEVKFMKAYGFMNSEGRLIDRATQQYVDEEGNPVSAEGYRLNANGVPVDDQGNPIEVLPDTDKIEAAPFTDEEGNPVEIPDELKGVKEEDKGGEPTPPLAQTPAEVSKPEPTQKAEAVTA